MPIHSLIAIENKNKTITSVQCHFEGHINGNGKTILKHYQDKEKIRALISGGNFISLTPEIKDIEYYGDKYDDKPIVYKNEQELLNEVLSISFSLYFVEYFYLFKNGKWFVLDSQQFKNKKGKWSNGFIELATLTEELNE